MLIFIVVASFLSFEVGYLGYQSYINYKTKRMVNKFEMKRTQLVTEREQSTEEFKQIKDGK